MSEIVVTERPSLRVQADPGELASFAASTLAREIGEAVAARGEAVVALPGGALPRQLSSYWPRRPGWTGRRWCWCPVTSVSSRSPTLTPTRG